MGKINEEMREYYETVKEYFDTLIVGEEKAKDVIISSLLCDKNARILISGKPGTGKSTISESLAKNFISKKIYMTSDLLPSDIKNAIDSCENLQYLQLEEINRTGPKSLSGLVEILGSKDTTTDEENQESKDFYCLATQNDTEIAGIFDTPQAIYDRFDVSVNFGNLTLEELEQVLFDFHRRIEAAPFNLREIIDATTKEINAYEYTKLDRFVTMQAVKILNEADYRGQELFASSNTRGHLFTKRIALFHALTSGKKGIYPEDIADYIENIYTHRINQQVIKMTSPEAQEKMKEIKHQVLSIIRPKNQG